MRWVVAFAAAVVTLVWGYYAVAYAACTWWWPAGNLCGLVAVPSAFILAAVAFAVVMKQWK